MKAGYKNPNNRIEPDSVNLSSFFAKRRKKSPKFGVIQIPLATPPVGNRLTRPSKTGLLLRSSSPC